MICSRTPFYLPGNLESAACGYAKPVTEYRALWGAIFFPHLHSRSAHASGSWPHAHTHTMGLI